MIFDGVRIAFVGHSHDPCVFDFLGHKGVPTLTRAYQTGYRFDLDPERRYVINVGSVGQPRERTLCKFGMFDSGGPAACYVHLDGDVVEWRKVDYNYGETQRRIGMFLSGNKKEEPYQHIWMNLMQRLELGR